jgi:sec-independent protein translocase protein TatC
MAADTRAEPRRRFRRRKPARPTAMTLTEHLGELRTRIIVCAAVFTVVSIIAFIFFKPIIDFMLNPLCSVSPKYLGPQGCKPIFVSALEPFSIRLKVAAMTAIVLTSPVWLYQVWAFVTPGLTSKERGYAVPFVATSVFLFSLGAVFAYLTLPTGLNFLLSLGSGELVAFMRADNYFNFVGFMLFGFGATFELPLLLFFLGLIGVVKVEDLRKQRRVAIVVIAFLAAVVTPSQDPYTMLAMALPLWLFYEITILLLARVAKRRAAREAAGEPV